MVGFLSRLSFFARVLLSNSAFAVPMAVLMYLIYSSQTVNIDFGAQEKLGNMYQRPLEKLLLSVSQYRIATLRQSSEESRKSLSEQIDRTWIELAKIDNQIGETLQFTAEGLAKRKRSAFNVKDMQAGWENFKAKGSMNVPEREKILIDLIAGLRTMITHAGDTSNLILDPDLDSYYLMDVTLVALPQVQDRLQDTVVVFEPLLIALEKRPLTSDEKLKAGVFAALLKDVDLARVAGSTETALNEDANFYGVSPSLKSNVEPRLSAFKAATETLATQLSDLAAGKNVALDNFRGVSSSAIRASYEFTDAAMDELDVLLDLRIGVLKKERTRSLAYGFAAMILAWIFAAWVGRSLSHSISNIFRVVHRLQAAAKSAMEMSDALRQSAVYVASTSSKQSASVQETVTTLREIEAMVQLGSARVDHSSQISNQNAEAVNQGQGASIKMQSSMDRIAKNNEQMAQEIDRSNQRIGEISKVISTIGEKTRIINDIVFQTKLLSFNASVEAARAGEHGKGFSVVAEEIGNLARISGEAANEINGMIAGSVSTVNAIVTETTSMVTRLSRDGQQVVDQGVEMAKVCNDHLASISQKISEMNRVMEEISETQKQQKTGIGSITEAMENIDKSIQNNAATAEETHKSADTLAQQASVLMSLITEVIEALRGQQTTSVSSAITQPDDRSGEGDPRKTLRRAG